MRPDYRNVAVPVDVHRQIKVECAKREIQIIDAAEEAFRAWIKNLKRADKNQHIESAA